MEYSNKPTEPFLTVREVANILRTSEKAIYTMCQRGHIGGVFKFRRRLLFERDAFLNWIKNGADSQKRREQ